MVTSMMYGCALPGVRAAGSRMGPAGLRSTLIWATFSWVRGSLGRLHTAYQELGLDCFGCRGRQASSVSTGVLTVELDPPTSGG